MVDSLVRVFPIDGQDVKGDFIDFVLNAFRLFGGGILLVIHGLAPSPWSNGVGVFGGSSSGFHTPFR